MQNVNITNTRVVNVTQVTNVYNTVVVNRDTTRVKYTYAGDARSITAVSRETFVGARPVGPGAMRVTSEQIERARVLESAPVAPTRTSYVSSTATISNARPTIPFSQRSTVVRLNPAVETRERQIPGSTAGGRAPSQPAGPRDRTTTEQGQPRPGYRTFEPPVGRTTAQPPRGTTTEQPPPSGRAATTGPSRQQQQPPPQTEGRSSMRYTPPVKAREEMYDVHPPQDRKQAAPPPQQQQRRAEPPRQQQDNRGRDDSKRER